MRHVSYKRHEPFQRFAERRNELLAHFILDVPHLLYFGVIPSRAALNQRLASGGESAGMSPGASWSPFEISEEEYRELVAFWERMPVQRSKDEDRFRYGPYVFFKDDEVLLETDHTRYLLKSREKYESLYIQKG